MVTADVVFVVNVVSVVAAAAGVNVVVVDDGQCCDCCLQVAPRCLVRKFYNLF